MRTSRRGLRAAASSLYAGLPDERPGRAPHPCPPFAPSTKRAFRYLALGDSIVTGAVTYWSEIESYADYLYAHLRKYYAGKAEVHFDNLARNGDGSRELLERLDKDSKMAAAVRRADLITLCIGGNNLLRAAKIPGFTEIDWDEAEKGVRQFESDWPLLTNRIDALKRPGAVVIANTLYNPYDIHPPKGYEKDAGLNERAAPFIARINAAIGTTRRPGWRIADVFAAFDRYARTRMADVTHMYPPLIKYILRNPHPTRRGQLIIAELCIAAYEGIAIPDFGFFAVALENATGEGAQA